ncbi:MAG: hypothetical protein ACR2M1_17365 [Gemmatimonadaceae bacterium]
MLSNDPSDVSGLVLSALDDTALPPERRVALVEEFIRQGAGDRIPPAALVEWFVAAGRALRSIDGSKGLAPADPAAVQAVRWSVAHFAARSGLAADCKTALEASLGGPVGTVPIPAARLNDLTRWQAAHPAVLDLLVRALERNEEPEAEQVRRFLRDQLTRQTRSGRAPASRATIGAPNV